MREILVLIGIFVYFIVSIIIGILQYLNYSELTWTYIIIQSIVFVISVFCAIKYGESYTNYGIVLSALGGGISMMIIIQTVLFFFFGKYISRDLSIYKIILFIILGLGITKLIHWLLTRNVGRSEF